MCEVVNLNEQSYDIYIGRAKNINLINKFGNPFIIGKDGNRDEVIEKYRVYLINQIKIGNITKSELKNMYGKKLGCFCKPLKCHGDILKEFIDLAHNDNLIFD